MIIHRDLEKIERKNCVLTIGTFDGVHLGHQTIIREVIKSSHTLRSCATLVTFEPHPQFVLRPDKKPVLKLLTTLEEKISILEQAGLDRLIVIPFTKKLSKLSSTQFIEEILIRKIGFNKIIIGYDFAFGKDREGNFQVLQQLSNKYHYSIEQMPPFSFDTVIISSTKIRKLLAEGQVARAASLMKRNYRLSGTVIHGEGRGRHFNIPTANLKPLSADKLIPQAGIYAGWIKWEQQKYQAVVYIGTKPTFDFKTQTIEVYIFEFEQDLYKKELEIEFVEKIRDDQKFDSPDLLYKQIEMDIIKTRELLSTKYSN